MTTELKMENSDNSIVTAKTMPKMRMRHKHETGKIKTMMKTKTKSEHKIVRHNEAK